MNPRTKRSLKCSAIALFCLETLLAVSALPSALDGKKTFKQYHQTCAGRFSRLYYTSCKEDVLPPVLKSAMSHPRTQKSIDDLFVSAENNKFSEIAGIITLDKEKGGYFFRFYVSKTLNEEFGEELINSENKIEFIKKNEAVYKSVTEIPPQIYEDCIKQNAEQHLIDWYFAYSQSTALLNLDLLYWEHTFKLQGTVISEFHLHQENPPSAKDLTANWLIIVNKKHNSKYTLYQTKNNQSYKIN